MVDEQNPTLPIANVGRIMKQILPPSAKLSLEAKQRMQDCATEFISFVTSEASDKCRRENRRTMTGDDICRALSALGLDNYAESITRYLHNYREAERERVIASQNKATNLSRDEDIEESDQSGQPSHQADETPTPLINIFL